MERYDRQIRLWSVTGQVDLENSKVVMVGTSLAIGEIAKNLILSGIGEIVFFINDDAFHCDHPLYERFDKLNNRVKISRKLPKKFDLVVIAHNYCNYDEWLIYDVPIIIVQSNLLKGSIAVEMCNKPMFIMQSEKIKKNHDLTFDIVWPELKQFCDSFNLDSLDDADHSHIPYPILLLKAMEFSKSTEDVRKKLVSMQRSFPEANFSEAFSNLYRLQQPRIPQGIKDIFGCCNDDFIVKFNLVKNTFWQHIKALQAFVSKHKRLPVSGEIPDMHSSPKYYIQLKELYKKKSEEDIEEFISLLPENIHQNREFSENFCKNSRYIQIILPNSLSVEKSAIWLDKNFSPVNETMEELMPVSSIIGGIASQEILKLLLKQYTPMIGILKYDGQTNKTETFPSGMTILN